MERSFILYVEKDSPFHRLSSFTKIFTLLAINLIALMIYTPVWLLLMITSLLILYKFAKVDFGVLKRFFIMAVIVIQGITISYLVASKIPGNTIYYRFPWGTYLSDMTVIFSFTMILRYYCMLFGSTLILATTRDIDLVNSFRTMHLPYAIGFVLMVAFRTLSNFFDDFFLIKEAMRGKGLEFDKGPIMERLRNYFRLGVPLGTIAVRRMLGISSAVDAKGFRVRGKRTYFHETFFGMWDYAVIFLVALLLVFVIVGRFYLNIFNFPGWPFV